MIGSQCTVKLPKNNKTSKKLNKANNKEMKMMRDTLKPAPKLLNPFINQVMRMMNEPKFRNSIKNYIKKKCNQPESENRNRKKKLNLNQIDKSMRKV